MTTDWKWGLMLFIRAVDATTANRQAFAEIYVNNGSLETLEDELKMFISMVRLSSTGREPAKALGISTPAKTAMKDEFKILLDGLINARYAIVANTKLPNWEDRELVLTNFDVVPNGQIVSWQDALQFIQNEFGFQVIIEEE